MKNNIKATMVLILIFILNMTSLAALAEETPNATQAIETAIVASLASNDPTVAPTMAASFDPTFMPTAEASNDPTAEPTVETSNDPTAEPTVEASNDPTAEPTVETSNDPTAEPTVEASNDPTVEPTAEASNDPTAEPTAEATTKPVEEPTIEIRCATKGDIYYGDEITLEAIIISGEGTAFQWQYSLDNENWKDISGETSGTMKFVIDEKNAAYYWRVEVSY